MAGPALVDQEPPTGVLTMPIANDRMHGAGRTGSRGLPWGTDPATSDVTYTPAEIEFMVAMERYRREHHRPYPTCSEVLAVLESLGYRKGA